jgi:hypothetical protein
MIRLYADSYSALSLEGRKEWDDFVRAHGFEPTDVTFPLEVDDQAEPPQMRLVLIRKDEQGRSLRDPVTQDVAVNHQTVTVQHPLPTIRPESGPE